MTKDVNGATGIIFDGWRSISISLFMALVGYSVMVSVPVLSTALVGAGFSEEQVGRVWGADLGGLSLGAVLTALLVARVNRQQLVLFGIIMSIIGNVLCLFYAGYDQVLWLRVIAGIGSGIFTAVAVVSLGGTTVPVRAFNMLLAGFAISTALELHLLPKMTMDGIYWFFIGLAAVLLIFIRWIPARGLSDEELVTQRKSEDQAEDWHVPKVLPLLCLAAICFTYINIGGYYTYIELAALADGVSQDWMTPVLTWSSLLAIVGCGLALVCARFGLFKPLLISLVIMALSVAMLSGGINDINVAISIFGFYTLWTFVDVYQSAMMAHMDRKGTLVALVPSVQGFGQFVGPNISASILGAGFGYSTVFMVSGGMALVAMFLYLGIYIYMHRRTVEINQTA